MAVVLTGLTITPDPATMTDEGTVRFVGTGHYDDGSSADISTAVDWVSSNPLIAEFRHQQSFTNPGLAIGVSPGTVTVTGTVNPTISDTAALTVTVSPPMIEPVCRFAIAFDSPTLEPDPVWVSLDVYPNLVTSYTIDRGRAYEQDRTDTGRATVTITDPDGILDPTNPAGPFYGKILPLRPAQIGLRSPVHDVWVSRYRGYIEDLSYEVDPSQQLNRLTIGLVDLFEILSAAEMHPGEFGHDPPEDSEGQVIYYAGTVHDRITGILDDIGLPERLRVIMPGAVRLHDSVYSAGENALAAVQEAADAEMPGSNTYVDRAGRLVFQDRRSRFDPDGVVSDIGWEKWDYRQWRVADGDAIPDSPVDSVQVRGLSFSRSLSRIINSASASPVGIPDNAVIGQLVTDTASIAVYGIRSWSADNLLTLNSMIDGANHLVETRRFAQWYCANYSQPHDRITSITFRSLPPTDPRAPALWQFLCSVDIGHSIDVHVSTATGGFDTVWYFVEGIHEETRPLTPDYDDVTLRLDLSPRAYYDVNPWPA